MGGKVFVSDKYKDYDVKALSNIIQQTWFCDYIKNKVLSSDDIIRGEKVMKNIDLDGGNNLTTFKR